MVIPMPGTFAHSTSPTMGSLQLHAIVSLASDVTHDGYVFPAGTRGTVVYVYPDQKTAEIEFDAPRWCVLTLDADQVN